MSGAVFDHDAPHPRRVRRWQRAVLAMVVAVTVVAVLLLARDARTATPALPVVVATLKNGIVETFVWRVADGDVRCYVVPNQYCKGDCSYTPAISCVRGGP